MLVCCLCRTDLGSHQAPKRGLVTLVLPRCPHIGYDHETNTILERGHTKRFDFCAGCARVTLGQSDMLTKMADWESR